MEKTYETEWGPNDAPITVHYYVTPFEAATREYPGDPGGIEIEEAITENGSNVNLTDDDICYLTEEISEHLASEAADEGDYRRDIEKDASYENQ